MMLRRLHTYFSIASAPIILFFCLSGALQLFDLHEAGGSYRPPVVLEKLATLHKKQRFAVRGAPPGDRRQAPRGMGGFAGSSRPPQVVTVRMEILRWVFLAATLALVFSTALGLWIGLTHVKRRRLGWGLLAAGAIVPVLIVAL